MNMQDEAINMALKSELNFLLKVIQTQGAIYSKGEVLEPISSIFELEWPEMDTETPFGLLVQQLTESRDPQTAFALRFILTLALAPQVSPQTLDLLGAPDAKGGTFTEYGRFRNDFSPAFLPTVQTALFILAGDDLALRFRLESLFHPGSPLIDQGILQLSSHPGQDDFLGQRISISPESLSLITRGESLLPHFSVDFPAFPITTALDWEDLVLNPITLGEVRELNDWLQFRERLMQDQVLSKRIKPGFRVLFHGPPGTGKTLTASLLGKSAGLPVFRIDLSAIISKYIGETEKNLAKLFARANHHDWILFFDEADALFGKRTSSGSPNDRYANQEVSYLLQRIEDYGGLVILASNFKSNIDPAFMRRFQSVVHFTPPKYEERLQLWENSFPTILQPGPDLNLKGLAEKYELNGANIVNILHSASIQALKEGSKSLDQNQILVAIRKELRKEDRVVE
ncbi:MAG: ATP-binding protein [Bacteroidia bacterium]|nr:ATP-binding protein [Bacteroidia bacterium]